MKWRRRLCPFLILLGGFTPLWPASQRPPVTPEQQRILDRSGPSDARCESTLYGPDLDFHFRHAGFLSLFISSETAGLNSRAADGELPRSQPLQIVGRLTPIDSNAAVTVVHQTVVVNREAVRRGQVGLGLSFYVGSGKYQLDWMLQTRSGRVCAGRKTFRVRAGTGPGNVRSSLEPGQSYFQGQPAPVPWWYVERHASRFRLKLILNIPPFKTGRRLVAADLTRIEGILTWLAFHPLVNSASLLVFNLKDQQIIYRGGDRDQAAQSAELAEAIRSLGNSEIRLETLAKDSDSRFLSRLLVDELSGTEGFDAVILVGPRSPLAVDVDPILEEIRDAAPVYYFKYRFFEAGAGWTDPFQKIAAKLGGRTFAIRSPQHLWSSADALMDHLHASHRKAPQ